MLTEVEQAALDSSARPDSPCRSRFSIGNVRVQIGGVHQADASLGSRLEPFRIEKPDCDIDIQIEWVTRPLSESGREVFDSGTTWRLYEGETGFRFDVKAADFEEWPCRRLLIDDRFRRGVLQLNEKCFTGFPHAEAPLGYPLDELLITHRLTQERAIELHGVGIVGPDGASNLFVGHSGAGKSTTARLWTSLHDVEILSDDRIIVREDKVREDKVREDKVREDKVCEGTMREDATQIFMYGTPWHGEADFALPQRAPLQRIFVLEHGHGNVLTRLTRSQTVAELFARSFVPFHRHEYVDSALSFLERVADSVPCYRYSFEPDERAVERILKFCD
jgi:hypothetical protein